MNLCFPLTILLLKISTTDATDANGSKETTTVEHIGGQNPSSPESSDVAKYAKEKKLVPIRIVTIFAKPEAIKKSMPEQLSSFVGKAASNGSTENAHPFIGDYIATNFGTTKDAEASPEADKEDVGESTEENPPSSAESSKKKSN